jgi:hypothetical protein
MFSLSLTPSTILVSATLTTVTTVTLIGRGIGEPAVCKKKKKNVLVAVFVGGVPVPFAITSINTIIISITSAQAATSRDGRLRVSILMSYRCPRREFVLSADLVVTTATIVPTPPPATTPVIQSITFGGTPGPFLPGSALLITGLNLTPVDTVTVGGIVTDFEDGGDGTITIFMSPRQSGANLPVVVTTTNDGTSNAFLITINPVIKSIVDVGTMTQTIIPGQLTIINGRGIFTGDIVVVTINGQQISPSPVAVQPQQVTFVAPKNLVPDTSAIVTITVNGATSAPFLVPVGGSSPPPSEARVTPTGQATVTLSIPLAGPISSVTIGGVVATIIVGTATTSSVNVTLSAGTNPAPGTEVIVSDGTTNTSGEVEVIDPSITSTTSATIGSTFVVSGAPSSIVAFDGVNYTGTITHISSSFPASI